MALINIKKYKSDESTGFGTRGTDHAGRYFRKDGSPNVKVAGLSFFSSRSWFHTLINYPNKIFLCLIFFGFLIVNLIFTGIYLAIGIDRLQGISQGDWVHNFFEVFFFSAQTFTTVGYGRISPMGYAAGSVSTFEAFVGLMSFALASGLFYARFSRPQMHVRFSQHALISPYKNGQAFMFRLAPTKSFLLTECEATLTLAIKVLQDGVLTNKFLPLELTISKINALSLSWTIVHEIKSDSPFYGFDEKDFMDTPYEVMIFLKAFDESYANQVISRYSYVNTEIIHNAKFKIMYHPSENGVTNILDFDLIDVYEKV